LRISLIESAIYRSVLIRYKYALGVKEGCGRV
jgi:hypothetical protein